MLPVISALYLEWTARERSERHHVYKNIWAPFAGEQLSLQAEEDNEHDKYAVAVLKDDYVVGHVPRAISRLFHFFLQHGINETSYECFRFDILI